MSARATCGEHKAKLINSVRGRVPLDKVVQPNERQFSDVKALEITPAKLTKLVSAFANSEGGDLYVGIGEIDAANNIREWRGFIRDFATAVCAL